MTATAEPPIVPAEAPRLTPARTRPPLHRGEGVELLGDIHGCGYRNGACLVRRGDGQMLQLGPLMYALLECIDGERDTSELAAALSEQVGRRLEAAQVDRLAHKLAVQGLLSGTEHAAPPRRNPLLALRWKILVTNPAVTQRLTAPFTVLFRPWLMWPILACFAAVFWFVLFHKGVASATTDAFHNPGLLLLVFVLAVVSAGFHELGHAAAARYGGATPGGMGVGLYLVWPAFYTDVTDAYRLPQRDRLRVDLAGLYFNAVVAVITMAVWLAVRTDALLLLVALQVLQMVKQLSPVIRADGYHILSDATGVPDLYSHMGSTLRRLLPSRRREPSPLTGRARLLVTLWVLIVVPVLAALMLGAVLLLPRLLTTAWDSGRHIAQALPHQLARGQVLAFLASLLNLVALVLPVAGSALVSQKILRTIVVRATGWSRGRPARRVLVLIAGSAALVGVVWALWPSGQYQPIQANRGATLPGLVKLVSAPAQAVRPGPPSGQLGLTPGTHLAVAMIPVNGATRQHPALFIIPRGTHQPALAVLSYSTPKPPTSAPGQPVAGGTPPAPPASASPAGGATTAGAAGPASSPGLSAPAPATAFPFTLPAAPGPGGTQALAVNTKNGGVTYKVVYALITVSGGAPVTNTNSAYALASCDACTTVAVSFQVVLIVGQSRVIIPINAAGALNYHCPACTTTAVADQLVVTLKSQPSATLLQQLNADLQQLNALPALGAGGTPTAVAAQVALVQQQIQTQLDQSGLLANQPGSQVAASSNGSTTSTSSSPPSSSSAGQSASSNPSTTPSSASTTPSTTSTNAATTSTGTAATPAPGTTTPSSQSAGSSAAPATSSASPTG